MHLCTAYTISCVDLAIRARCIVLAKLGHLRHRRRNGGGSHEGRERKRKGTKMRRSMKKENGDNDEVINK